MEKDKIVNQLRRIEGQVRGVATMVEGDRGLIPTMQQFMAVQAACGRVMRNYVSLFLFENKEGEVILTREQTEYILSLINKA